MTNGTSSADTSRDDRMRAVIVRAPGGPEQLEVAEEPVPRGDPGVLESDAAATARSPADLLQTRGAYPPPAGAAGHLGLGCAGVARAVFGAVGSFRVGDRVMALLAGGGYAERVVVP